MGSLPIGTEYDKLYVYRSLTQKNFGQVSILWEATLFASSLRSRKLEWIQKNERNTKIKE
jgi:hypothetical protein